MKEGDIGTGNVAVTIANCQQEKELITNLQSIGGKDSKEKVFGKDIKEIIFSMWVIITSFKPEI